MRRYRVRRRAAGVHTVAGLGTPVTTLPAGALTHRILDARSLAMHCLAAAKIERDPRLLKRVKQILEDWLARYKGDVPLALEEWKDILKRSWPEISSLITDPGERATRMRQSSPFSSILSPAERNRIYAAFRP